MVIYLSLIVFNKGKTMKKIMWCDDEKIKPYFINAGKILTYRNLRKQMEDSLEDKPFPELSEELQKHCRNIDSAGSFATYYSKRDGRSLWYQ